jgi:hypothetical protein
MLTFSTPGPYNSRNVHIILVYPQSGPAPSAISRIVLETQSRLDSPSFQPHSAHRRACAESLHCWLEIAVDRKVQSDSVALRAGEADTTIARTWYSVSIRDRELGDWRPSEVHLVDPERHSEKGFRWYLGRGSYWICNISADVRGFVIDQRSRGK